jgi:hypothetical protein
MVLSSTIREARAVWFKFRIINTGDTILDPEGFGAAFAEPRISKLNEDGSEEWSAGTTNAYERFLNYIYPGESTEMWVNFFTPKLGPDWYRGLKEGNYRVDFRLVYRYHRDYNWWVNVWTGAEFCRFVGADKGGKEPGDNAGTGRA